MLTCLEVHVSSGPLRWTDVPPILPYTAALFPLSCKGVLKAFDYIVIHLIVKFTFMCTVI